MGWTERYSDAFNRSNESPLASPWSAVPNMYSHDLVSNQASYTAGSRQVGTHYSTASLEDKQYAQVKAGTTGNAYMGAIIRQQGAGGDCYLITGNSTAATVALYRKDGTSYTQLGSTATGVTIMYGTAIRIEGNLGVISGVVGGVTKLSPTDPSPLSGGTPGMYGYVNASVATLVDDFSAGDDTSPAITVAKFLSTYRRRRT